MPENPVLDFLNQGQTQPNPAASEEPAPVVVPGPTPSSGTGNPVLDFLDGGQAEVDPQLNIEGALEQTPDRIVEVESLSRQTGWPVDVVNEDLENARKTARTTEIMRVTADAPVTSQFIQDPDNAAVSHDAVEQMTLLEQSWRWLEAAGKSVTETDPVAAAQAFGEGILATPGMALSGLGEIYKAFGRRTSEVAQSTLRMVGLSQETVEAMNVPVPWYLSPGSILQRPGEAIQDIAEEVGPSPEDENFVTDVAGGLGQITAQITVAVLTGGAGSTSSLTTLLGQGADIQVDKISEDDKGSFEADMAIFSGAGVTAVTERLGLDVLLDKIPASQRHKIYKILMGAGSEAAQEIVEGVMQNMVALAMHNPDIEVFDEGLLYEGSVAGAVGAIMSVVIPGRKAIARAEQMDQSREILEQSPLTQRDPERAAEHNAEAMKQAGIESVQIPATQLREWTKGDANLESFLGVSDQMQEALFLGTDVTLDNDRFTRHVLLSENYQAIREHVRFDPEGMTAAEAQEFEASGIEREMERIGMTSSQEGPDIVAEPKGDPEAVASSQIAELEAGLQALFRTADEAGMTEKQYAQYLEAVARASQQTVKRQEDKILKDRQKELTKEWQRERQKVEAQVTEKLRQRPAYQVLDNVQRERMNRDQLAAVARDAGVTLDQIPRQPKNRTIYEKDGGLDPQTVAEIHGYDNATDMVMDLATSPALDDIVQADTDRIMRDEFRDLHDQRQQILAARQSLLHDDHADVLVREMNSLREAVGQKRVGRAIVRRAARHRMRSHTIKNMTSAKYMAAAGRLGRSAGRALRKGDRQGASNFKFQQALTFQMAVEAQKLQNRIDKDLKFMRRLSSSQRQKKVLKTLPLRHLDMIRDILGKYSLSSRLSGRKREKLMEAAGREAKKSGVPLQIPARIAREDSTINYQDLPYSEFREVADKVREIHKNGTSEDKMRRAEEKETRSQNGQEMASLVRDNVPNRAHKGVNPSAFERAKKGGHQFMAMVFNMDTLLKEIDGGALLGRAYDLTKGRYDKAFSSGYRKGQIGATRRRAKEARAMTDLWTRHYTKKQRHAFGKSHAIPGVRAAHTRADIVSVLLNSGNADNIQAMKDSGQYTDGELRAIHDFADKRDWQFAQDVWDYLDTLWPEISETTQRRKNYRPEKVSSQPVQTPHGRFRGGYYPLRYDSVRGMVQNTESLDQMAQDMRLGKFVGSHTRDGHTETRVGSGGRHVMLDPFVFHGHVEQVVYDLEMGDAVTDIYKVITQPDFREAMAETGNEANLEAMDAWLADQVTGEIRQGALAQRMLRNLRAGFTVSKLGWNVGTIALQPLGLLQSAALLGKRNLARGTFAVLTGHTRGFATGGLRGGIDAFQWVREESPFMAERDDTFQQDITEAQQILSKSWANKRLPLSELLMKDGLTVQESFFVGIKKMQKIVDTITWVSAQSAGMELFDGDYQKSKDYADRIVARSQGSGIFGERTAIERGTISLNTRQQEVWRSFTVLQSYFLAKLQVASDISRRTNFRNPASVANAAIDFSLLFTVEAILVGILRGQFPDDEDDDLADVALWTLDETVNTVAASVPFVREVTGEARGFPGGGLIGSIAAQSGRLKTATEKAFSEGELNASFLKNLNNTLGIFLRYPSSQINKTLDALFEEDEDVAIHEYFMGQPYEK